MISLIPLTMASHLERMIMDTSQSTTTRLPHQIGLQCLMLEPTHLITSSIPTSMDKTQPRSPRLLSEASFTRFSFRQERSRMPSRSTKCLLEPRQLLLCGPSDGTSASSDTLTKTSGGVRTKTIQNSTSHLTQCGEILTTWMTTRYSPFLLRVTLTSLRE